MGVILLILYGAAGYWAVGQVLYPNTVIVFNPGAFRRKKLFLGVLFGYVFIPIAIVKKILFK